MIPMQARISEPLPFSLLKAFCSFFLISLYVDDNYICIPISVELYHSFIFLWPPSRIGTAPSSWSCLPGGISGTYLKSLPLLQTLKEASLSLMNSMGSSLNEFFHYSCIHPIFTVAAMSNNFSLRVWTIHYSPLDLYVYCSAQPTWSKYI